MYNLSSLYCQSTTVNILNKTVVQKLYFIEKGRQVDTILCCRLDVKWSLLRMR